LQIN
jgi:hypothetical protein